MRGRTWGATHLPARRETRTEATPMTRKTLYFSGMVQGVGFRYTAHRLAQGREVTGYVRNLPDGRVEMVAEGKPEQIDGLVEAVHQALRSCIHDASCSESPATGEFRGFDIAF